MGYEIFDDIVCITLEGNTERQELVEKTLKSLGIKFRFYVAKKHPRGGRVGCFESHMNVTRECYQSGKQKVLIFEDDVVPSPAYSPELLNQATTFMTTNTTWEIFQLGWGFWFDTTNSSVTSALIKSIYQLIIAKNVAPHVYQHTAVLLHAYCLSRAGMKRILDNYEPELNRPDKEVLQPDEFTVRLFNSTGRAYCIAPFLFDQRWCLTSNNIARSYSEKIIRLFQCNGETTGVFYVISLLLLYRNIVLVIILCVLLYIFFR